MRYKARMKLLRVMPVPRDIRSPSDIVAGDVAVFAGMPVTLSVGDEVAVYEGDDHEIEPALKGLATEDGHTIKAYSFIHAQEPRIFLFVLRTKEAVSA